MKSYRERTVAGFLSANLAASTIVYAKTIIQGIFLETGRSSALSLFISLAKNIPTLLVIFVMALVFTCLPCALLRLMLRNRGLNLFYSVILGTAMGIIFSFSAHQISGHFTWYTDQPMEIQSNANGFGHSQMLFGLAGGIAGLTYWVVAVGLRKKA